MITFQIPGKPIPQERRIHIRGQWAFDPAKSRNAKKIVRQYAEAAKPLGYKPSDRSYSVQLSFLGPRWNADIDNLTKLVLDAIKGIFWIDDHQVVELHAQKIRVPKGQEKTVIAVGAEDPKGD